MIKLCLTIPSLALYRPVEVTIALPYSPLAPVTKCRTIWALHPAMENGHLFFDRLPMLDAVDECRMAVVAPSLGNGYYIDNPEERQFEFLRAELMPALCDLLPLSPLREENLLLGISMGAFGAAHWALAQPEKFAAVALISGVYDASLPVDERARKHRELRFLVSLFSERIMPRLMRDAEGNVLPDADIRRLYAKAAQAGAPRFFLWCGEEDYLCRDQSERFERRCRECGIDASLRLMPGAHDLRFWKAAIPEALEQLKSSIPVTGGL